MSDLLVKLKALPRWVSWVVIGVLIAVVYFAAIDPALTRAQLWTEKAGKIQDEMNRDVQLATADSEEGRIIAVGEESFGSPHYPTDPDAKPETLYRVVDRVLHQHNIDDATVSERSSTMRSDLAAAFVDPASKLERFALEVSFESDTLTAVDVIASLERSPEISAVGRVRLDKSAVHTSGEGDASKSDTVRVTITPEIWMVVPSATPSAGGAS